MGIDDGDYGACAQFSLDEPEGSLSDLDGGQGVDDDPLQDSSVASSFP